MGIEISSNESLRIVPLPLAPKLRLGNAPLEALLRRLNPPNLLAAGLVGRQAMPAAAAKQSFKRGVPKPELGNEVRSPHYPGVADSIKRLPS
jgi:hypothetical protein